MYVRLTTLLLALLLAALLSFLAGVWLAYDEGQADCQASHDRSDMQLLTQQLQNSVAAMNASNAADKALREALARRQGLDEKTTKELRHALKQSASARAGCRFDDDSMRIVTEARERAAQAAASGLDGAVPAAGGSARP